MLEPKLNLPALPAGRHYRFHAMNKPSGAECNIDCDYCFYLHKTDLLKHDEHARMVRVDQRGLRALGAGFMEVIKINV